MHPLIRTALQPPWREPVLTAAVMICLLAVNLVLANMRLGSAGSAMIVGVGVVQAGLVLWLAMEVRRRESLVKLFAFIGVFFVAVMFVLSQIDYLTR